MGWSRRRSVIAGLVVLCVAGGAITYAVTRPSDTGYKPVAGAYPNVIVPAPVSAVADKGVVFTLPPSATIGSDVAGIGDYLAGILRTSTGYAIPIAKHGATISLRLTGAPAEVGASGYRLAIDAGSVLIEARSAAGLFAGVQTLLQALPPAVQSTKHATGPWTAQGGVIVDYPRYAYRGAMLDVARHFFTVAQVERYIDEIALYKINYLHLHLTDDQGWRVAITGLPQLTAHGGSTSVGGGSGGYYSQADYRTIVAYAASRYITVVPEIDMPGHTNAALASIPALNCDAKAPQLYTGIDVGFSSLCVKLPATYTFLDRVIGQLAAMTPGPYVDIGGDESNITSDADYATLIDRAQQIVRAHGKTAMGWHDIENSTLLPSTVAEFWGTDVTDSALAKAAASGTKVIMAPATRTYLDMKYTPSTTGKTWAAIVDVNDAYGWDPGNYLHGVGDNGVFGVEAALWTETVVTSADIEYMAFPRLPAIAELGWSPSRTHDEGAFDARLAAQGPRWRAMGMTYYPSHEIPWPATSAAG